MNARPATPEDFRPDLQPVAVPVHVASVAPGAGQLAAAAGPDVRTVYRTVTLTAADPCQEIMAASDKHMISNVIAIEADIVLGENKSDTAGGHGAYIPCVTPTANKPNLSVPYPVRDYRTVYAAAAATLTGTNIIRVSVTSVYRV